MGAKVEDGLRNVQIHRLVGFLAGGVLHET